MEPEPATAGQLMPQGRGGDPYQGVFVLAAELPEDHNELDLGDVLIAQAVI